MKKINNLLKRISVILFLTDIAFVIFISIYPSEVIGFILGSIGSYLNFFWLAHLTKKISNNLGDSKIKTTKGFYFRFLSLALYAFIIVYFIKPNIIMFGLGLLSVQAAIYLDSLLNFLKLKK